MITAKQAYEIAKEWMGPFRGKLWTDHASFWIDKTNGALKIVSAIPTTKEYEQMQQGTQLNLEEMCE